MRATATQYAKTLYELTKGKNQKEIDEVVSNFAANLQKNGQLKLAGNISQKFSEIYNAGNGTVEAEVVTCEKISGNMDKEIKHFIKERYQAKEVILHNKIDEKIKGGIIIKVGDEIIDASVDRKLKDLKKYLEK